MKTSGLRPVELDGAYYLEDPTSSELKLSVGELLVYDRDGNELNTGYEHTLTFTTVKENEEYILEITLDRACLEDADTAYPVVVDPSFEILSDNEGIMDIAVRANGVAYSDSLNNGVGHHNSLLEDMRSFIKFPGLLENETYGTIAPPGWGSEGKPEITSVKLQLYSRGTSIVDTYVSAYRYDTANSLDWTNATKKFTTAQFNALGTLVCKTKVPYSKNVWVDFDITNMVTNGNAERGIVLVNEFEGEDNEPAYQSFASTEDPTNKPRILVTWSGESNTSFDSAPSVGTGMALIVSPSTTSEKLYYAFTPTEDAFYTIESSERGSCTPSVRLYNSDRKGVTNAYAISSTDQNCRLVYHMSKDTTYYIEAWCSGSVGTYTLSFRKTTDLSTISYTSELERNVETSAVTVIFGGRKYLTFTPEYTCSYTIASSKNSTYDPQGWLYDSTGKLINSNDNGGTENNFRLKAVLTKGKTYYIAVAFKGDGIQNCKVTASVTMPEAPLTLTSSNVTGDSVKLTWTMPSDYSVDRWLVQKRVKGASQWENATATNTKPITVSGLSANTTYEFRVISEAGAPAWKVCSEPSKTITVATLPAQPTNLTASDVTKNSLKLTWNTVSPHGADRWVIEYRVSGGTWARHGVSHVTNYSVTGLKASTTYEFRVYAERYSSSPLGAANSLVSNTATATTKVNVVPATPTDLIITKVTGNSVSLAWTTVTNHNADRWLVQYRTSGGSWVNVANGWTTYATVTGLSENTKYEFRVYAEAGSVAWDGTWSASSNTMYAVPSSSLTVEALKSAFAKLPDNGNYDGQYELQCVDLYMWFIETYAHNLKCIGRDGMYCASDLASTNNLPTRATPTAFTVFSESGDGNVFGSADGEHGHVGIVISVDVSAKTCVVLHTGSKAATSTTDHCWVQTYSYDRDDLSMMTFVDVSQHLDILDKSK